VSCWVQCRSATSRISWITTTTITTKNGATTWITHNALRPCWRWCMLAANTRTKRISRVVSTTCCAVQANVQCSWPDVAHGPVRSAAPACWPITTLAAFTTLPPPTTPTSATCVRSQCRAATAVGWCSTSRSFATSSPICKASPSAWTRTNTCTQPSSFTIASASSRCPKHTAATTCLCRTNARPTRTTRLYAWTATPTPSPLCMCWTHGTCNSTTTSSASTPAWRRRNTPATYWTIRANNAELQENQLELLGRTRSVLECNTKFHSHYKNHLFLLDNNFFLF